MESLFVACCLEQSSVSIETPTLCDKADKKHVETNQSLKRRQMKKVGVIKIFKDTLKYQGRPDLPVRHPWPRDEPVAKSSS